MTVALTIRSFSDVLDMYGDADSLSTYSLSGHVTVSLTSPSSLFVRRRQTARILLQSLAITFEGQSEMLSPVTGYAPVRLCSITRELLSGNPTDLSNEGHEESDKSCMWNVVFDIPIPGWLPTTSVYGDASLQAAGTSYALYATATFVDVNNGHSAFSFANICGPVRSRSRTIEAHGHPITLRRFTEPQPGPSSNMFQTSVYFVDASRSSVSEGSSRKCIPSDILERIQVVASIPSATAIAETSFPFVLRVRGKDLDDSERKRLRITEFSVSVEQVETYRKNLNQSEIDQCPIPPQSHQPPQVPLRNPHPVHTLYDTGFLGTFGSNVKRSFSILPPTESGRYVISGDGYISSPSPEDSWYTLETKIPILTEPHSSDWAGMRQRRITERSPLFSVEHYVHAVICCGYDPADSGEMVVERLHFSLPMKHVNVPEVIAPPRDAVGYQCGDVGTGSNSPYTQTLPAYSQLFHSNGEQKFDDSIPLPLYQPASASLSGYTSDQQTAPQTIPTTPDRDASVT